MGLFQSMLSLCPCSSPRKTVISPEVISHPYPLAPKYPRPTPTESRFRPHPLTNSNRSATGPYRQLESPTYSHAHSKTVSESTTSTAPQLPMTVTDGVAFDGLGLGMRYGLGEIRQPDRAYVLAERSSTYTGTGTSSSGKGRKLKKTRLVEGDWELVRTDFEDMERRSKRSSRLGGIQDQEKGNGDGRSRNDGRIQDGGT
jgi:hypothetical protein